MLLNTLRQRRVTHGCCFIKYSINSLLQRGEINKETEKDSIIRSVVSREGTRLPFSALPCFQSSVVAQDKPEEDEEEERSRCEDAQLCLTLTQDPDLLCLLLFLLNQGSGSVCCVQQHFEANLTLGCFSLSHQRCLSSLADLQQEINKRLCGASRALLYYRIQQLGLSGGTSQLQSQSQRCL